MKYKAMAPGDFDLFTGEFINDEMPTVTVHETDDGPVFTGLLDASGTPLYRVPERVKVGFVK